MTLYPIFYALLTLAVEVWMLTLASQPLWADVTTSVFGKVADPTGAAVPRAHVTLSNALTGLLRDATIDFTEAYEYLVVPVGAGYSVAVEAQGFEKLTQSGITLLVNQRYRADFKLRVGAVTQSVNMSAEAAQVETANTQFGNVIESHTIKSTPLNGRSYTDLLSQQAGIVPVTGPAADTELAKHPLAFAPAPANPPAPSKPRLERLIIPQRAAQADLARRMPQRRLHLLPLCLAQARRSSGACPWKLEKEYNMRTLPVRGKDLSLTGRFGIHNRPRHRVPAPAGDEQGFRRSTYPAMNHRTFHFLAGIFLLMLIVAVGRGTSQDDEADESEASGTKWATLAIDLSRRGDAHLDLYLPQKPDSQEALRAALGQALHCSATQFASPQPEYSDRLRRTMSAKQWERYRSSIDEATQKRLIGNCTGVLATDGWIEQGSLEMAPLAEALRTVGVEKLALTLSYPVLAFHELSQEGLRGQEREGYAQYVFTVRPAAASLPLRIAFGFRPRDLRFAGLIALGFVLVPILVVLWMRRVTLKSSGEDTMGAWFSYHRAVNWCVTATILLWIFSDFHARQNLDRYFGFRWGEEGILQPLASSALIFVPLLIVYAASVALSYQVFVRLRQTEWKRREYLLVQLLQGGSSLLPIMFVVAGIQLLFKHERVGIVCFALAYVVYLLCTTLRLRAARTYPQALTTGELRDKVFELAKRAAVAVRQVFVLPAGKGQIANAYASKSNLVIFTDYLLERLSKREVNTVAGHELTHLQRRHPMKLMLALWAAIFAPSWVPWVALNLGLLAFSLVGVAGLKNAATMGTGWYRAWAAFEAWTFRDLLLIALGFSGFYFLSRRFEFTADAGAVALTGDAEAAITALLKLNRLNLMPVQWGKVSGAWLTHPTTLRRIECIAEQGGVAPERLRQILDQHSSPAEGTAGDDHYAVPSACEDRLLSYSGQSAQSRFRLWVLIIFHWLPAVGTALVVDWRRWEGLTRSEAYLFGLAATLGFYWLVMRWLGVHGRAQVQQRLLLNLHKEGIPAESASPLAVGLSPGATPRFYVSSYNWDTGLLLLAQDRLYFLGSQLRFALTREQVLELRLGPGAPSWISMPRVYLRWKDTENNREGVLNLASAEPCSAWALAKRAQELFERLSQWKQGSLPAPSIQQLETLRSPALGEVTSFSPKALTTPGKNLRLWFLLVLPVAVAACVLLGVEAIWYVVLATVLVRVFEMIPHWRYRERPMFVDAGRQAPATSGIPAGRN